MSDHDNLLAALQLTRDQLLASNRRIEKQQLLLSQALSQLGVKIETISIEEANRDQQMANRIVITKTLVTQESTRLAWVDKIVEAVKWLLHLH